jgi:hypothetical protein
MSVWCPVAAVILQRVLLVLQCYSGVSPPPVPSAQSNGARVGSPANGVSPYGSAASLPPSALSANNGSAGSLHNSNTNVFATPATPAASSPSNSQATLATFPVYDTVGALGPKFNVASVFDVRLPASSFSGNSAASNSRPPGQSVRVSRYPFFFGRYLAWQCHHA